MRTALIIGASRGIGLELARQYLHDGWRVLATARRSEDCDSLTAMGAQAFQVDVTELDAIEALGTSLAQESLDVAFLNAGMFGPRHDGPPTQEEFDAVMHTNVLAAMRILPMLAPLADKVGVLSSAMGSIGERSAANATLYRASKAALNSVLVDTALSSQATCVALHPGWVKTDMGGAGAQLDVEVAVAGLRATMERITPDYDSSFLNYDGTPIPW
ncbi:SDR family oxidoreductase [Massilia sp. PAMC28688]|uniref:SDR family oxidoreductase n=1 Tax=Massilia sp. PAMC28688 TaxID=2861283 RepID=UPI001C62A958|nr:SDR family oxidoreductase [Massilia sp. PAMC28688]QYF95306.1 SDR family oxidoreductase [Massilia sp. PAMC28688]